MPPTATLTTDPGAASAASSASATDAAAKAAADKAAADKAASDKAAADAAAAAQQTPEQKAAAEKAAADAKAAADKKAADDKAAAEKAQRERVYALKLPDKSLLDASVTERTTAIARELGLSSDDAAQKVLDFTSQEVAANRSAMIDASQPGGADWNKQVETWNAESLKDPELGNGKPETLVAVATKVKGVLEKYASQGVIDFLHNTGYGSNPAVLKFLANIAKAADEGKLVTGVGGAGKKDQSAAETIYGGEQKT